MRKYSLPLKANIERKLKELDRKPAWLADKSGVGKPNISRILKGEGNPSLEMISKIANAFGCHPWELLYEWPKNTPIDQPSIPELIKEIEGLKTLLKDSHDLKSREKYRRTREIDEVRKLKGADLVAEAEKTYSEFESSGGSDVTKNKRGGGDGGAGGSPR